MCTVGTVGREGDTTLTLLLLTLGHLSQVDELCVVGQAARILFAATEI
jgi:hypothetical protein